MKVQVGSILFEYTGGREWVEAEGATLAELVDDLDRRFPGLAWRVRDESGALRPHVAVFLDQKLERDPAAALADVRTVHVFGALSGG